MLLLKVASVIFCRGGFKIGKVLIGEGMVLKFLNYC